MCVGLTCDQRSNGAVFSSKLPFSSSSRMIERRLGGRTIVSTCGGSHCVLSLVGYDISLVAHWRKACVLCDLSG